MMAYSPFILLADPDQGDFEERVRRVLASFALVDQLNGHPTPAGSIGTVS
jgi:hypothetical protein